MPDLMQDFEMMPDENIMWSGWTDDKTRLTLSYLTFTWTFTLIANRFKKHVMHLSMHLVYVFHGARWSGRNAAAAAVCLERFSLYLAISLSLSPSLPVSLSLSLSLSLPLSLSLYGGLIWSVKPW
jgi:hypothetical protein